MVSLRGAHKEHVRCLAEWWLWRSAPHQVVVAHVV